MSDLEGFDIDVRPIVREGELRSKPPEYAGILEWGTKVEVSRSITVADPLMWDRLARGILGLPAPRTWPRWWCWLCGHTPTETDSLARDTCRCRCSVVREFPGERREAVWPTWWLNLVGGARRPWRHTFTPSA